MTAPRLARPTPLLLAGGALLVLLATAGAATLRAEDVVQVAWLALAGVVAAAAVLALPKVEPAVPLTLGLCASIFSGHWSDLGSPVPLDKPLLLYGIAGSLLGLLPDSDDRPRPRITGIHFVLLGVSVWAIGSALLAGTLLESEPLFALLDKLGIFGFLLFLVAPVAFARERDRDLLLMGAVAVGAYLSVTALLEALDADGLIWPAYITDASVGIHIERARGPFAEAAANGLALYACAVLSVVAAVRVDRRGARTACIAVAALCAVGLVFTLTRQAWLGATIATVLTMLAAPELRRFLLPTLATGAVAVIAALALVPGLQSDVSSRSADQSPVWDRLNSNRAAVAMIEDRPLAGFGWYAFAEKSPPYYRQAETYPLTTVPQVHNVFLSNAAELGLVVTLAWVLALATAVGTGVLRRGPPALRPWKLALLAIAIDWAVIANFTPLAYALPNHLLWTMAGIACAFVIAPRRHVAR